MVVSAAEIETMARMEHDRYVAERLLEGFTPGPRSLEKKTSPYLVGWDELSEKIREIDRSAVRIIPKLLASAGFEIYRLARLTWDAREPETLRASLPAALVIGAAGHRKIGDGSRIEAAVAAAVRDVSVLVPRMRNTDLALTVLSPLAEGADRIVARAVLKVPGSRLEVVLPMDRDAYEGDFASAESRREFDGLVAEASAVRRINGAASRTDAYVRAGRFVVDHCDILIAVWDGGPAEGPGGTAEVVAYARSLGCPLIWMDPTSEGKAHYEPGKGLRADAFRDLDFYNGEAAPPPELGD